MKLETSGVWDLTRGRDEISTNLFNLIFTLIVTYGMIIYGVAAALVPGPAMVDGVVHRSTGDVVMSLGFMVVAFVGCFVAASDLPLVKGIGLTMISGGLGAVSGPFLHHFKMVSIIEIAGATILLTLILGAVGVLIPQSLQNWGTTLLVLLIGLVVMQLLLPLAYAAMGLPLTGVLRGLDWLAIILFGFYLVYDFNRARDVQKTIDNAIDCGISVFLDVANIFIRLMSLFGQSDD